jgi:hypothetical protein
MTPVEFRHVWPLDLAMLYLILLPKTLKLCHQLGSQIGLEDLGFTPNADTNHLHLLSTTMLTPPDSSNSLARSP